MDLEYTIKKAALLLALDILIVGLDTSKGLSAEEFQYLVESTLPHLRDGVESLLQHLERALADAKN